ncbi:hypothetical protein GCM10028833_39320 [Glycomyces tarimensis]
MLRVVRQEETSAAAEARILEEAFEAAGQAVFEAMADLFGSRPCRMSARDYTRGLLASLERKNCVTGDRGVVPAGQRPRRPRPAPGPHLGGDPPAPHPRHGRLPGHHPDDHNRPRRLPEDDELDRLTLPETAHLIAALALTLQHTQAHILAWSRWRRRKNKAAR